MVECTSFKTEFSTKSHGTCISIIKEQSLIVHVMSYMSYNKNFEIVSTLISM